MDPEIGIEDLYKVEKNNNKEEEEDYLKVHWLAYNDELEEFILFYNLKPQSIFNKSKKGNNCLHIASVSNSKRVVIFLLQLSNSLLLINERNKWNETSLHVAIAANNIEIVSLLLQYGADYTLKDSWGRTPKIVSKLSDLFVILLYFL